MQSLVKAATGGRSPIAGSRRAAGQRGDVSGHEAEAGAGWLRSGRAGERHHARPISARPGVRDEASATSSTPDAELCRAARFQKASVLPIAVSANGRVNWNALLSCARPSG